MVRYLYRIQGSNSLYTGVYAAGLKPGVAVFLKPNVFEMAVDRIIHIHPKPTFSVIMVLYG